MQDPHRLLNLGKPECPVFPLTITSKLALLSLAEIWSDDRWTHFSDQVASVCQFCRFALFNGRKMGPFLTRDAPSSWYKPWQEVLMRVAKPLQILDWIILDLIQNVVVHLFLN